MFDVLMGDAPNKNQGCTPLYGVWLISMFKTDSLRASESEFLFIPTIRRKSHDGTTLFKGSNPVARLVCAQISICMYIHSMLLCYV